jgi:hypothetical protein
MKTPASCYAPSQRVYPEDLPDPVYPPHFELRRVIRIGVFTWKQHQIFLTEALRSFEHIADGLWSVFCGEVLPGRFSEIEYRFVQGMGR